MALTKIKTGSVSDSITLTTPDINGGTIDATLIGGTTPAAGTFTDVVAASLDISGDIDVDGTTNLDVVDIDGAVDMASTLKEGGTVLATAAALVNSTSAGGFGFGSNTTAFYSFGADASTAGSYTFQNLSNNASVNVTSLSLSSTGAVFNEGGVDADFRVESDNNAHALFVDASTNRVGLFTNAPAAPLEVYIGASSSADADGLNLTNSGENGSNLNFKNAFGTMVQIKGTKQGGGGLADEGLIEIRTAVNGTLTGGVRIAAGATSWSSISDERLKDIIEPITNAAEKVSTLRAVIGNYKTDPKKTRRPFLIAQDIQAVLPEAVDDTDENELSLRYTETIPLLVAAIQEQQELIKTLESRITALES
jgi:hypothetical protein